MLVMNAFVNLKILLFSSFISSFERFCFNYANDLLIYTQFISNNVVKSFGGETAIRQSGPHLTPSDAMTPKQVA